MMVRADCVPPVVIVSIAPIRVWTRTLARYQRAYVRRGVQVDKLNSGGVGRQTVMI